MGDNGHLTFNHDADPVKKITERRMYSVQEEAGLLVKSDGYVILNDLRSRERNNYNRRRRIQNVCFKPISCIMYNLLEAKMFRNQ